MMPTMKVLARAAGVTLVVATSAGAQVTMPVAPQAGPVVLRGATAQACKACHAGDDAHKGTLGGGCESCHTPAGWARWSFDHERQTDYPLEGAHRPGHFDGVATVVVARWEKAIDMDQARAVLDRGKAFDDDASATVLEPVVPVARMR